MCKKCTFAFGSLIRKCITQASGGARPGVIGEIVTEEQNAVQLDKTKH